MLKSKVRKPALKYWCKSMFMGLCLTYIGAVYIFSIFRIVVIALVDGLSMEAMSEIVGETTGISFASSLFLLVLIGILYKSSFATPLANGSTRYEAHVGYEIFSIMAYLFVVISNLLLSVTYLLVFDNNFFIQNLINISIIGLFLLSAIKLLYSIYLDNTKRIKCIIGSIIAIVTIGIFAGTSVGRYYLINVAQIEDYIFNPIIYLILIVVSILIWRASSKRLIIKLDNIELADIEQIK